MWGVAFLRDEQIERRSSESANRVDQVQKCLSLVTETARQKFMVASIIVCKDKMPEAQVLFKTITLERPKPLRHGVDDDSC